MAEESAIALEEYFENTNILHHFYEVGGVGDGVRDVDVDVDFDVDADVDDVHCNIGSYL